MTRGSGIDPPGGPLSGVWEAIGKAIAPVVAKQLSALLPVIVAAVVDALLKKLPTPEDFVPPPITDLVEDVRHTVNQLPDIDIPVLSDIFDLSEWIKKV